MDFKRIKNNIVFLFVFFLMILISAFSQTQQGQNTQQELSHEVRVTLKLIQVYVTDKKGNPVTNLEKGDFELLDNKKLQDITEFERHILTPPPSKQMEDKAKVVASKKLNRKFFLFFDFAFQAVQMR